MKSVQARLLFTLAIFWSCLLHSTTANATEVTPLGFDDVVRQADVVVVGTISSHQSRWGDASHRWMLTDFNLVVEDVVYPSEQGIPVEKAIVLTYWGGTIGGERQALPDVRVPVDGERVVMVLHSRWASGGAVAPTVGFNHGFFQVSDDAASGQGVVRDAAGKALVLTSDGKLARETDASGQKAVSLTEFSDWLRANIVSIKKTAPSPRPAIDQNDPRLMKVVAKNPALPGLVTPDSSKLAATAIAPARDTAEPGVPVAALPTTAFSARRFFANGLAAGRPPIKPDFATTHHADAPIIVNDYPAYFAPWSPEDQYQMSKWNYYADVFRVYVTPTGTYSYGDGVFDLSGFPNDADLQRVYGASWYCGSGCLVLGVTFPRYSIFTGSIIEADIALNPNASWTLDDEWIFDGSSANSFRHTMIHELGHMHGLDHNFDYLAIMNYLEPGYYRANSLPYGDDAAGIRFEYPANAVALTDLAVYLYYETVTCANLNTCVAEAAYPSSVTAGGTLTVNNYHVENSGTTTIATPTLEWYLTTVRSFSSTYYYLGQTTYPSLATHSYFIPSTVLRTLTVPANVPAGSYYLAAYIRNDAGASQGSFPFNNNVSFSRQTISVNGLTYSITVSSSPAGGGTVGGGGTFAAGSSRTVTASANSGYTFTNWTENGGVVSSSSTYTFTLNSNRTLIANFTVNPVNYTINVSASPLGSGTVSGGGTFAAGTSRTVTASANSGYTFANWTESGSIVSSSSSYTFTLNSNRTLIANFTVNPVNYSISVSASPAAGGSASGGGTFAAGSSRTVTAVANPGYAFISWTESGVTVSVSSSYTFILNSNRVLTANFSFVNSHVRNDFNGDGKSDIIWRNTAGDNHMWFLNANAIAGGGFLVNLPSPPWILAATGDFNGDGRSDLLWRNTSTGDTHIWLMNGTTISGGGFVANLPPVWIVAGTGDFNGDGKADIIWRNTSTGDTHVWLMNGNAIAGGGFLVNLSAARWSIASTGDYNGDGKTDIIWRDNVTGDVHLWLLNANTIIGGGFLTNLPVAGWSIAGTGDFNGDGKADIIWRNNATGDTHVWLLNGNTVIGGGFLVNLPPSTWSIGSTADFNGDGKSDVIWRNNTTGDTHVWLLNGNTIIGGGFLVNLPAATWSLVSP
ncbi:MAG TPA: FG-GAP-like repeat-containing protein [Thermoanaerobaculia bacterium]|nr:FG-GAP-like repeat-containing protein [Thermoanaerobaculia bacterium]